MKKYIAILLSGLIALQPLASLAAEPNSSDVLLTATPQTFSAIVPTKLPVNMGVDGVITTAEDAVITNTSKGPIMVSDLAVEIKDSNWSMAHFTADFNKLKVNSKVIGLQFNGDNVTSSGTTELNPAHWPAINGLESMTLDYNAKLAAQSIILTDVEPVTVVFTLKWHEAGKADIVDPDTNTPLEIGGSKILTFNFTNIIAEDNSVVWSSSDEGVATVKDYASKGRAMISGSKSCEVTAVSAGIATITGTLKDGTSASMDITVTEKVDEIPVGTKHIESNYEYSYGQELNPSGVWATVPEQNGWGVRLIDNTQTDYVSPLTMIQGRPVTNMSWLFRLSPVTTLNLIDWDTSNVTNMYGMFNQSKATNLDLSSFETSNITDMRSMFSGNRATNLDLSSFETSNVTDMSYMFANSQATSLDLSSFDTSKVTNMNGMFNGSPVTSLDLSSFDTSNVTDMSEMFSYSQATSLDLSSFDTSNVTNMRHMFYNSHAINIDMRNFNTKKVNAMNSMFENSLATNLDVSKFDTRSVTDMNRMFRNSKTGTLDVSNFNTSNATNMSWMFETSQATSLDLSNFDTSNVTNMAAMFSGSKATNLDLRNFDTSNVTNMRNMFGSSQAISIDLSNFNTSKITDMNNMFSVSQATSLDLSSFDTSNVTNMESMFNNSQATSFDLSSFNTSNVTNMFRMFSGSQATNLDLSSFNTANVTRNTMYEMFSGSQTKTLIARTQADADKYKRSGTFPSGIIVTIKS